jgi:hypothetical protein
VSSRWKQGLLALPSVGFSMFPKLACPACWPAYAGLLTSVGLGFLISAVYLLPLTIAFLVLALGAMVFRATERHGYRPFLLGMVAASGVLLGKFVWASIPSCTQQSGSWLSLRAGIRGRVATNRTRR